MPQRRIKVEQVDHGNRQAEIVAILRYYLAHPEKLKGLMVMAELPDGAYDVKYSGTENVAERLGRLQLLMHEIVENAEDIIK